MTAEQMVDMMQTIFPAINAYQRRVFLNDICEFYPKKFGIALPIMLSTINDREEREFLENKYCTFLKPNTYSASSFGLVDNSQD